MGRISNDIVKRRPTLPALNGRHSLHSERNQNNERNGRTTLIGNNKITMNNESNILVRLEDSFAIFNKGKNHSYFIQKGMSYKSEIEARKWAATCQITLDNN